MTFYRHPSYPQLAMCTACHAAAGSLRSAFESYDAAPGASCIFDTPRAKALLRAGDRGALEAFLGKRARMSCPGSEGSAPGTRYFHPPGADDVMACAACYEDFVLALPSSNWEQTAAMTEWTCDLAPRAVRAAWSQIPPAGVVALMRDRAQMPRCLGEQVPGSTYSWYTTRQHVDGFVACDACYLDLVAFSPYDAEFVPLGPHDWEQASCDMHKLADLWSWTLVDGNVPRFIHFARAALAAPECSPAGAKPDNSWVQLPGLDFAVCPACAASYVEPLGLHPFFQRASPPPGVEWSCDLCPSTPMGQTMRTALAESVSLGRWRIDTLARAVEGMPRCPHHEQATGQWFGFSELRICPACWVTFGSHTSLAGRAPLRNAQATGICSLWSPRMRALWLRACAGGLPLPVLLGIARERTQVYAETILVNGQIVQEAEKERRMAKTQAQFGLNKIAMSNISLGVSNERWSAPGVFGTHGSPIGIEDDRQYHAAQAALRQLPLKNARRALQIRQNVERWNTVE
ncbi:uncharacterized protein LOC62_07G009396 [Vanrija pseudolonga]|uniref:Uncharacterized protein n=1 Tax=Vanrija pseudolonga TaxID=143232 RepID=A0AAF0YFK1_9TREE|nr:hypothetical protein LOC62_07G009396 [Vanrija pseudolonga]